MWHQSQENSLIFCPHFFQDRVQIVIRDTQTRAVCKTVLTFTHEMYVPVYTVYILSIAPQNFSMSAHNNTTQFHFQSTHLLTDDILKFSQSTEVIPIWKVLKPNK